MVELKDRQQKETEHKLQSHSCLTLMEQVLGSLLDSDLSILLRKPSSDVWVVALFLCHRWHRSTGLDSEWLPQASYTIEFRSHASETISASLNKENLLAISCTVNLFGSSSSSCFSSFLWASNPIRSSLVSSMCCTARNSVKSSSCKI